MSISATLSEPFKLTSPHSAAASATAVDAATAAVWGKDGFTFGDILDAVNPVQQLPVVSTLYREATGATISNGARMIGGGLLGGPLGLLMAGVNAAVEIGTGQDLGGHFATLLKPIADSVTGAPAAQAATAIKPPAPPTPGLAPDQTAGFYSILQTLAPQPQFGSTLDPMQTLSPLALLDKDEQAIKRASQLYYQQQQLAG